MLKLNNNLDSLKHISILDVAHKYLNVEIKKSGSRYSARCPWHANGQERTASLFFDTNRNLFKCFACGIGGSNIDLAMNALNVDFKTACEQLAQDFNLPLPWGRAANITPAERRAAQAKANEAARRRELAVAFKKWCDETYLKLCVLVRCIDKAINHDPVFCESIPDLLHLEPVIEYWLDVLQSNNDEQKLELFKDEAVKTWTTWNLT